MGIDYGAHCQIVKLYDFSVVVQFDLLVSNVCQCVNGTHFSDYGKNAAFIQLGEYPIPGTQRKLYHYLEFGIGRIRRGRWQGR